MKNIVFLLAFALLLSLQSCSNYLNLTQAQSLGKDNNSLDVEGEVYYVHDDILWASTELKYARGITENYDFGIYANTNALVGFYNKYQVYDSEKFDVALGLDAKYSINVPFIEVYPTLYLTKYYKKYNVVFNPSLFYNFYIYDESYALNPSFTLGVGLNDTPFRIGYTFSVSNSASPGATHGLGFCYRFDF